MIDVSRGAKAAMWVAGVTVGLLVVGSFALNVGLVLRNNDLNSQLKQVNKEYTDLYAEYLADVGSRPTTQTPAQVEQIVGQPGATGAQGERGEAGKTPTSQEILDLFKLFCADGRCKGETGATGVPGADGQSIVGPAGPAGAPGSNGVDGRSVTSIQCDSGLAIVFYDQNGVEIGRVGAMCF